MKARFAIAALAAASISTLAAAQMGAGMDPRGMGPGMMGTQGAASGPGEPGGQGMGHGKMGGRGMGPGMMGDQDGCPMGKAMMGGHGKGRGMMGGHGKEGGMMGGHGMEGGMMGGHGFGALESLGLNDDQKGKVRDIRRDTQKKRHALMGSLLELRWQAEDNARAATVDEAAARKQYDAMAAVRKQMFEIDLDAQKRVEAVLTPEQRAQLRKAPRRG